MEYARSAVGGLPLPQRVLTDYLLTGRIVGTRVGCERVSSQ